MATRTTGKPKGGHGELKLPKVRKDVKTSDQETVFELNNVGPFNLLRLPARPGVNIVSGGIESGKTVALEAIEASRGTSLPVEIKDGETEGFAKRDGRVVAEFKRAKGKQPYISLASESPIARVVNAAHIKGQDAAEETRIRGLIDMVGLKTTEETVRLLLTPESRNRDEEAQVDAEAYDYVDEHFGIEKLTTLDPVAVVDVLLKGKDGQIHKLRRRYERAADEADVRCKVTAEKVESDLTAAEAQKAYDQAVGDHRELQGGANQRAQAERQRAEIESTLGDEPNVVAAHNARTLAIKRHETNVKSMADVQARVEELQRELAALKGAVSESKQAVIEADGQVESTSQAHASWERRKKILETPITGATPADVEAAAEEVQAAGRALEIARAAEEYQKQFAVAATARAERDTALNREKEVKKLAESIPGRLGELFGQAGIPDARVVDGVFQVKNDKGKWEAFERRSEGAKWRTVLPIWIQHNPEGLLVMVKGAWNEFDIETQVEIHEILVEHDVIAFVEVTNGSHRGDPLTVRPFEAVS